MPDPVDLKPIKDKLQTKGSFIILFGQNPSLDHVAASLGLFLVLKQADKDVHVASPSELRAEFSRLTGLDKVSKSIGNRNLVISFSDYELGSIEKISHPDSQGEKFELIIQPKPGHKAPNPKNIEFSYKGAQAEAIFLIGVSRLEDLGPIYESERKVFTEATIVSFNRRQNPNYSAISVVDSSASSLSEIVTEFIEQLSLKVDGDAASTLLAGIDFATNRFQNPIISPGAFLTAGKLLQSGARRQAPKLTSATQMTTGVGQLPAFMQPQTQPGMPQMTRPPSLPTTQPPPALSPQLKIPAIKPPPAPSPTSPPTQQPPLPPQPLPSPQLKPQSPQTTKPQPPQPTQSPAEGPTDQPPPKDWLQPKIYKGSTRV